MIFGDTPLDQAEGAVLAHSHRLEKRSLKKGRVLDSDDVALLRDAGFTSVIAALLEDGDVAEDAAADRLAAALAGDGTTVSAAFTGRANLYAQTAGVVLYDPVRLDAFNLVDEAITLALVPPYQGVEEGQMIGTLKIISFAVSGDRVLLTEEIGRRDQPMVRLQPYQSTPVGLVQSRLSGTKESVLDSTMEVTRARLHGMASEISHEVRCDHTTDALAQAIDETLHHGARLVLVSGASAVVDRRDVVPAAIEQAGGIVEHFGMPVDPGNLMLIGRIGDIPVVGLPGCARSPKLNGFDWVLQRLIAGVPVGRAEIGRMGVGGLLKDIPTRPMPRSRRRASNGDGDTASARAPKIAAILLAAGQSRRMGSENKLLAELDGKPMVRHVAEALAASKAASMTVVLGHEADTVRASLADLKPSYAYNPDYAEGLSTSMKTGIAAVGEDVDGAIICLGDMPMVSTAVIDRMIAAFDPVEGRAIVVPTRRGKRGNPVLFAKRFFEEMGRVSGDVGARHLIGNHEDLAVEIEVDDESVLTDIDTPEALAKARGTEQGNGG
ncbi:NTP transferase domain-containing protein [Thalassobaculum salexigens]|uniref:NTP transferase domain-containing protein n=1 Tax=Thalassobaculum salexigens TaxID=455360 RepID=UPI0003F575EF|nr:molybdopterin-binding/glycosyltransferase family 2 protein [Thalassobaculum salexigens]